MSSPNANIVLGPTKTEFMCLFLRVFTGFGNLGKIESPSVSNAHTLFYLSTAAANPLYEAQICLNFFSSTNFYIF
jgi:hypothetical protein